MINDQDTITESNHEEPKKVLLFEDDFGTVEVCKIIIEGLGFRFAHREQTNDILNVVLSENPDLIIIDNWMPGQGGVASIKILKTDHLSRDIPIIYTSAINDFETVSKQSGADDFLQKPFDLLDLENKIKHFLYR